MRRPHVVQTQIWLHFIQLRCPQACHGRYPSKKKKSVSASTGPHFWLLHPCLHFPIYHIRQFQHATFQKAHAELPNSPLLFIIQEPQAPILLLEPGASRPPWIKASRKQRHIMALSALLTSLLQAFCHLAKWLLGFFI